MAITKEMQKELAGLARAANRRIERADPGQRDALMNQIKGYHVRERSSGLTVFEQGKAKSEAEYRARMKELKMFMKAKTTTRTGWKEIKSKAVKEAGKTIRAEGSDLTDEELNNILQEIDKGHSSAEFYKALANVEIAKGKAGDKWEPDPEAIRKAVNTRRSAQKRTEMLLKIREQRRAAGV